MDSASAMKPRKATMEPAGSRAAAPMAAMAPSVKTQNLTPMASSPMPRANALTGVTPSNMAIHLGGGASSSGSLRIWRAAAA